MSIHHSHLREYVIRPVLKPLGLWDPNAEELLIATAAHESKGGAYLAQVGGGPALGVYQMEPKTYYDLWDNYLNGRASLVAALQRMNYGKLDHHVLSWDLGFASTMCRLQYRRFSEPLPSASDIRGIADYWHTYWCRGCKGTQDEFITHYREYVRK